MKNKKYVLVINCGSSSIKLTIFEEKFEILHKEYIEKVKNHKTALRKALKRLKKDKFPLENIRKVGHRVVHGGEKYTAPTRITAKVLKELEGLSQLAPLHNPANIAGIKACMKLFPNATHTAVFDTAYFSTLPEKAYLYALPFELYKKHDIRKYGFHGTSHEYVVNEALSYLKKNKSNSPTRVVSCHLGNGASITASVNGVAVDTSMGFTPLEGIPMGTRSGDIDPAIIFHLAKSTKRTSLKKSLKKIHTMLEKESGLKGVSELSHDMRVLRDAYFIRDQKGKLKPFKKLSRAERALHEKANRTMQLFCYRIAKYIGGYAASLNGLDTIIFTATIGEKADYIRKWVCEYLEYMRVKLDNRKNTACTNPKELKLIHDKKSKVKVFVIPTNEALQIARNL
ncbi:acetate kinase [Candidatus Peregrinibacteria bacterium]|nr:acetate kinase [Candidatus Peregrinibacteria bacterium]